MRGAGGAPWRGAFWPVSWRPAYAPVIWALRLAERSVRTRLAPRTVEAHCGGASERSGTRRWPAGEPVPSRDQLRSGPSRRHVPPAGAGGARPTLLQLVRAQQAGHLAQGGVGGCVPVVPRVLGMVLDLLQIAIHVVLFSGAYVQVSLLRVRTARLWEARSLRAQGAHRGGSGAAPRSCAPAAPTLLTALRSRLLRGLCVPGACPRPRERPVRRPPCARRGRGRDGPRTGR